MSNFLAKTKLVSLFLIFTFLFQISGTNDAFAHCPSHSGQGMGGGTSSSDTETKHDDQYGENGPLAEPIFLDRGEFFYNHQDVFIPSRGIPIDITRYYRSQKSHNGSFGYGWFFSFHMRLKKLANENIVIINGDGKIDEYTYDSQNLVYISPAGVYNELVDNGDGTFTLTEEHGTKYEFDSDGKITSIRDRNQNQLTFTYDAAGLLPITGYSEYLQTPGEIIVAYDYMLTTITDDTAREINLTYNSKGRLETITDFSGRTWTYTYDDFDNLFTITTPATTEYPAGLTTTYGYDADHNLETITDAKGQTYLTNHYDSEHRVYQQDYGSGTAYLSYDEENNITTFTDFKGFVQEWTYDDYGNPLSKEVFTAGLRPDDPASYLTRFEYNANLERIKIVYPRGNATYYEYDSKGNILQIWRSPQGQAQDNIALGRPATASSSYSDMTPDKAVDGDLGTIWNSGGFSPSWLKVDLETITEISRMKVIHSATHNQTYSIDISDDDVTYVEVVPSGSRDKDFVHNFTPFATGRYIRVNFTDGEGDWIHCSELEVYPGPSAGDIVTSFTYEPNFNFVKTITDPEGNVTTFTYDYELDPIDPNYGESGNLTIITYPEVGGQIPQTDFSYSQYGQLEFVVDPNGNTTQYVYYDATGYLWKIIQDPGSLNYITDFTYDDVGNIATVTNARGNATTFEYNELNQLTKQIAPSPFNFQTKYSYDQNRNLTQIHRQTADVMNPWQSTQYSYTILDQLETITDPLGNLTSFAYDANGNRSSIADAENNITTYDYDERDLIWKTIDDLANVTEYSYDLNGNLAVIKDARLNETTYIYDGYDRLQTTTYADSSYVTYSYDDNSNLTSRTTNDDPATTITYVYDVLNRLDLKTYSDATEVDYVYDLGSRLTSIENPASRIDYNYDTVNRITQTQTLYSLPATLYSVEYQYDEVGNRKKITYPSNYSLNYTYDALNRLTSIQNPGSSIKVSYTYDPLSRRVRKDISANKTLRSDYHYDIANRLNSVANKTIPIDDGHGPKVRPIELPYSRIVPGNNFLNIFSKFFSVLPVYASEPGMQLISSFNYTYDNVGNRLDKVTVRQEQTQETYGYDDIYQLTQVSGDQTHSYDYDAVGNREVVDGTTYSANNLNQYTVVGAQSYSYDDNGNLENDGTNSYTYDFENRLITVIGGQNSSYEYDGFGRRISKTVDGITTYFVYDGDQVIEERDYNGTLAARYTYGTGIDEVIRMRRDSQNYYYFADGLGSVTELLNANGSVVESYSYDVYGHPNQVSAIGNPYLFTGRRYDTETGLYHYRRRYYDLGIGRFVSRDPVTEGTLMAMNQLKVRDFPEELQELVKTPLYQFGFGHHYLYTRNNPINYVDPYGLWYIDINLSGGKIIGATGGVMISPEGLYFYGGGGLVTPPGGVAVTWSPGNPVPGWNVGFQAMVWHGIGSQVGYSFGEGGGWFVEFGFVTPGASLTGYYVFDPWIWPWKRDECKN